MEYFGFDTIGIRVPLGNYNEMVGVLEEYTKIEDNESMYLAIKPSLLFNGGIKLTTMEESLEYLEIFREKYNVGIEVVRLERVDFGRDLLESIGESEKKYTLFLELLSERRKGKGIFKTIKEVTKTGNLKTATRRKQSLFYCCEDKKRLGNTRLENRELQIRNSGSDRKILKKVVNDHIKELAKIEELLPFVEERYIKILCKYYDEQMRKDKIRNFTDFIVFAQDKILTVDVLKALYKYSGLKGSFKPWYQKYRSTRNLELVCKKEIKEFIRENQKGYRAMIK